MVYARKGTIKAWPFDGLRGRKQRFLAMARNDEPGKLPEIIAEKLKKSFKAAKGAP